jgi:hypothetical protein
VSRPQPEREVDVGRDGDAVRERSVGLGDDGELQPFDDRIGFERAVA